MTAECGYASPFACRQRGEVIVVRIDVRGFGGGQMVRTRQTIPTAHESGVARLPNILGVPFMVGQYAPWRYRADPARRPFPGADRFRIVHCDPAIVDDCTAALRLLPFERVARQH